MSDSLGSIYVFRVTVKPKLDPDSLSILSFVEPNQNYVLMCLPLFQEAHCSRLCKFSLEYSRVRVAYLM